MNDVWHEIARKANVDQSFNLMKSYPDHVAYDLVEAASEILDTQSEAILKSFGEHRIQYSVDESYCGEEKFLVTFAQIKAA